MKNFSSPCYYWLIMASLIIFLSACEKDTMSVLADNQILLENRSTTSEEVILIANGYHGASSDGSVGGCPTGGGSCFFAFYETIQEDLDEAVAYVNEKAPNMCVAVLSLKDENTMTYKMVYAGKDYEKAINEQNIDYDLFGVGKGDIELPQELLEKMGLVQVTLKEGYYPVQKREGDNYWNGIVEIKAKIKGGTKHLEQENNIVETNQNLPLYTYGHSWVDHGTHIQIITYRCCSNAGPIMAGGDVEALLFPKKEDIIEKKIDIIKGKYVFKKVDRTLILDKQVAYYDAKIGAYKVRGKVEVE